MTNSSDRLRDIVETAARKFQHADSTLSHLRDQLTQAEQNKLDVIIANDDTLAGVIKEHGLDLFINSENADVASVIYRHFATVDVENRNRKFLGDTVPREALQAYCEAVKADVLFDINFAAVPTRGWERHPMFSVAVDDSGIKEIGGPDAAVDRLTALYGTYLDTQNPNASLTIIAWNELGSTRPNLMSTTTTVRRMENGSWVLNSQAGQSTRESVLTADVSLREVIFDLFPQVT